ncbi:hypothetical protein [Leucobacter sp.]
MPIVVWAIADLALLLITAGLGLAALLVWSRHRAAGFPAGRITAHVVLQILSIGIWTAFAITGAVPLGWIAFAVITAGQVLGDLLMFASHRARHPGAAEAGYRAVSGDVLSFRRPVPALHALVGALAWFGMLAICVVATVAG